MKKSKLLYGIGIITAIGLLIICFFVYTKDWNGEDKEVGVIENGVNDITKSEENIEMDKSESKIHWMEKPIEVYIPKNGGVWYPRVIKLRNGDMLCGFDTNEDGGRSVIKIVRSIDGGNTWTHEAIKGTDLSQYDCANANFYELDNGDIWLAYRANVLMDNQYYSSIRVNVSKDDGNTWNEHSLLVEESGEGGVYEPQFQEINGEIAIFYANDSLNVVKNKRQQNIEYKIWSNDNWSDTFIASNGQKTYSRDGMPVISTKVDGSYVMILESTSLYPSSEFIIQIKESKDGHDWETPLKNIYIPKGLGKKAGAPYIVTLEDGRFVVAFQTDEDATEHGDQVSKMKVMLSKDSKGEEFLETTEPFQTPDGYSSSWNCLYTESNMIYAFTSSNYPKGSILMNRGIVE